MSDRSERRLQRILNREGFYTIRSPGSGTGLKHPDPTVDRHLDHPDVVAIRGNSMSDVLVIEDKHTADYPVYVDEAQYDGLRHVADITGAYPVFAVQVKQTRYPHTFHPLPIDDQTPSGTYVLRQSTPTISLHTLTDRTKRP